MSSSNCCFLTCIQISQEAGKVVWYSQLFKNFLQFVIIHIVKGFNVVNEADVFSGILLLFLWSSGCWQFDLWFLCLYKSSLNIWKFLIHILLKSSLKDFEHNLASMWNKCNCVVIWTFFGTALLWDWNENWLFSVLWPLLSFPNFLAYWVQHFHSIIFQYLNYLSLNSITSTSFVCSDAS